MNPRPEQCPDIDQLAAFASGDPGARAAITAHLDRCGDCRRVVAAAAAEEDDEAQIEIIKPPGVRSGPRVARFVIQRVLGEGAMGIVHLAYDPELRRNIALKVIKPDSGDGQARERLFVEAQTAAQLTHPNTVTVYDVGIHEGQPYVAMEFVEGTDVESWLKRGAGWREALAVMLVAGEGLAAAHGAGLVHRDFKPANILLGNDGTVKVSDFGLARFADERIRSIAAHERELELPRTRRAVTESGQLVGTPGYIAPEQFAGETATPASDQFAFGVALYRALYGVRPFRGPTLESIYQAIAAEPPPPPPRDSRVPLAVWPVVERALAKSPDRRYPSMADLLAALREASGLAAELVARERCPFPGLASFAEADARLYFGRDAEVGNVLGRLSEQSIAAIVGPSGAGKSSFVRALVIPTVRRDDPARDVLVMRPGPAPLLALARLVIALVSDPTVRSAEDLATALRTDHTRLATLLTARARHFEGGVLLYIDQLEELYAQCPDREERIAFASALAALAVPGRSLRLVVTLRSDFLDRAAECDALMARITAGFVFLGPPGRATLAQALVGPLAAVGYELEDPAIADEIASGLESEAGAFPLLQFVGGRLWDERDRSRRTISRASLASIGAVAGALAAHADQVLAQLAPGDAALARQVLVRLVTPERTRHAVVVRELETLSTPAEVNRVIDVLVRGRLLVAAGDTVELVHEALIGAWPTLRGWLADEAGDAKLLGDLGAGARRWDAAGRPEGMLWSGEPARRALALADRVQITALEAAFVAEIRRSLQRAGRRRRLVLAGAVATLGVIAVVATVAFFRVRESEHAARASARAAELEASAARAAENQTRLATDERDRAQVTATTAKGDLSVALTELQAKASELEVINRQLVTKQKELEHALTTANAERARAEANAKQLADAAVAERALREERDLALKEANAARAKLERRVKELEGELPNWK